MIKRIRIPVDHGNGNIKTMNTVFKTGISASDLAPGRGMEYLEYNGKFYLPSNRRIPYQRDKTKDFRFFALTLMGIAKELELNKNVQKGDIIQVQMPIGLPPKHFAELYEKYETYFRRNGELLHFRYKDTDYHISIIDTRAFPQDYAAVMLYHKDIAMYPRTTAVDIGAFTGDYLMFRYGEVDMEFCDSMEMGIISLYNRVITGIRADYDQLLDEMDIDSIIRGKYDFYEGKIVQAVLGEVQAYARDLLSSLRERGVDPRSTYMIFLGGGSILLKPFLEQTGMLNRYRFIEDIHANAKGYDWLYQQGA